MNEIGKIPGPTLMGCYETFVGAAPLVKRPPPPKPRASKGAATKSAYGQVPHNPTVPNAKKLLVRASKTAAKAVKSAVKALQAGKVSRTQLGAVAINPAAAKTPKQKQAVAKHQAALKRANQAGRVAAMAGKAAHDKAVALAKKMQAHHDAAVRIQTKRGASRLGGMTIAGLIEIGANTEIGAAASEWLENYYDQIGADPDPNKPGFMTDGTPDPAYADASALDPSLAADAGIDPSVMADPLATASVELPPPPPMDTHFADMANVPGAIPYDGSHGTPDGFIGSLRFFTRESDMDSGPGRRGWDGASIDWTDHYGFVFGKTDALDHGGSDLQSGTWNHVHGGKGRRNFWDATDAATAHGTSFSTANPNGVAYGPIVGNPKSADWRGLRADDKGNLFWLPQEAPKWATWPLEQAAAMTAKAEQEAAAAAAKADAAAAAKQQADAALAQAQQDAANALAESQAASEQSIAQAQQQTQAQQMDLDQAKADQQAQVQQQQQDAQAQQILAQQAQQEVQTQQQVQQMLLEKARREEAYLAEHPEEEFAPQDEYQGGDAGDDDQQYAEDDGGDYNE